MNESEGRRVYRRHRDVSFSRFGEEMLVVVPRKALNFVLNGSGARVLELIDGRRTVADIAAELGREYEGASAGTMTADVFELIEDLHEKGAVIPADPTT